MSKIPAALKYTAEHEWATYEGGIVTVGITDFAQDQLGDITYLELPDAGTAVTAGDTFGVVESVKTFSDLYSPVDGEVVESNAAAVDAPESINGDPYGVWLIKIRVADDSQYAGLLDAGAYGELAGG